MLVKLPAISFFYGNLHMTQNMPQWLKTGKTDGFFLSG